MKSAITASSGTPSPVIRMPVWPVARNVALAPRARIACSIASAVYILPTEQSVPTARQRRPVRGLPLAIGYLLLRHPHVVKPPAMLHGGGDQLRLVAQQVVQPGREVHPRRQRRREHREPSGRDDAAPVRHADDEGAHPGGGGLGDRHVRQPHVGVAAFHAKLSDRRVGPPVADSLRDLGRQRIGGVAEKEQIGRLDHREIRSSVAARA